MELIDKQSEKFLEELRAHEMDTKQKSALVKALIKKAHRTIQAKVDENYEPKVQPIKEAL